MESVRLLSRLGGGHCKQKNFEFCCRIIESWTTTNELCAKLKFVLNVILEPYADLYIAAIAPPRNVIICQFYFIWEYRIQTYLSYDFFPSITDCIMYSNNVC